MAEPAPLPGAAAAPRLLADVGGTKCRFALQGPAGHPREIEVFHNREQAGLAAAATSYLERHAGDRRPTEAAFSVACPIDGDDVRLTNFDWAFSIAEMRAALALDRLEVINDFAAIALGLPGLAAGDRRAIGTGSARAGATMAVLGPGTGLGVALLVPAAPGDPATAWSAVAGEGGHVTLAAADDAEARVIAQLRSRLGHVSAEAAISGPGLVNLYRASAELAGAPATELAPRAIAAAAAAGTDDHCVAAAELFSAMLGTVAGNLALSAGARGGVYLAGGVIHNMGAAFDGTRFRERFEAKGRLSDYNAAIATYLITRRWPAFAGLAALLDHAER